MATSLFPIDASDASPTPAGPVATGETSEPMRQCGWCCNTFPIITRPGRPLIYCRHSCRQRAYERRRGLGVLPPPDRIIMQPGGPLAHLRPVANRYECGSTGYNQGRQRTHSMRPSGIAGNDGKRLTLCGLLAHSRPRPFSRFVHDACLTCVTVADIREPARSLRSSDDLAALRSLLDAAAIEISRSDASNHRRRGPDEILTDLLMRV